MSTILTLFNRLAEVVVFLLQPVNENALEGYRVLDSVQGTNVSVDGVRFNEECECRADGCTLRFVAVAEWYQNALRQEERKDDVADVFEELAERSAECPAPSELFFLDFYARRESAPKVGRNKYDNEENSPTEREQNIQQLRVKHVAAGYCQSTRGCYDGEVGG